MYIHEISLLKEFVNRIGTKRTNAEYGLKGVGSRTQVRNGSQIFESMTLLLKWIIRCGSAFDDDFLCLNLKRLLCLRSRNKLTRDDQSSTDIHLGNLFIIVNSVCINHLNRFKEGTVIDYDKSEIL